MWLQPFLLNTRWLFLSLLRPRSLGRLETLHHRDNWRDRKHGWRCFGQSWRCRIRGFEWCWRRLKRGETWYWFGRGYWSWKWSFHIRFWDELGQQHERLGWGSWVWKGTRWEERRDWTKSFCWINLYLSEIMQRFFFSVLVHVLMSMNGIRYLGWGRLLTQVNTSTNSDKKNPLMLCPCYDDLLGWKQQCDQNRRRQFWKE